MAYIIPVVSSYESAKETRPFFISCPLWNTAYTPKSYGYLWLIKNQGFMVKLICEEREPLQTYFNANDPVYEDSALEAFFQFQEGSGDYFNFEMNSSGALLAQFGPDRLHRTYLAREHMDLCTVNACIGNDAWSVTLTIPFSLLKLYHANYRETSCIRCNFYKICETPPHMHFMSWSPIIWETPNFHLPQFFGQAVPEKKQN